jgi:hypothetical protein
MSKKPPRDDTSLVPPRGALGKDDLALTALPLVRNWLFTPDRSRLKWRKLESTVQHEGVEIEQSITIGEPNSKISGVLTTKHQRAIFVLQRLWEEQGCRVVEDRGHRVGRVSVSSYVLENALFGSHGGRQKKLTKALIHELNAIPLHFKGFILPDNTVGELYLSGLIHGAMFTDRKGASGRQIGMPWAEITISPWLLAAWEKGDLKPIDLKTLDQLSTDLAKLLYPKLDWLLSKHDKVEYNLLGLCERLGLTNAELSRRSRRHRKFASVATELTGAPLSSGGMLVVEIEECLKSSDYKLVATRKGKKKPLKLSSEGSQGK